MKNSELLSFINHYIDNHQSLHRRSSSTLRYIERQDLRSPEKPLYRNTLRSVAGKHPRTGRLSGRTGGGGIETAFIASFGNGHTVISLLGEYDALADLSQKSGYATPESLLENGNVHGCRNNLFGIVALASAFAVKAWIEQQQLGGTVRFYGCPGEESCSGKKPYQCLIPKGLRPSALRKARSYGLTFQAQ